MYRYIRQLSRSSFPLFSTIGDSTSQHLLERRRLTSVSAARLLAQEGSLQISAVKATLSKFDLRDPRPLLDHGSC